MRHVGRLLLLIVFSFSLVMLWDAWLKYQQPKNAASASTAAGVQTPPPQPTTSLQAPAPDLPQAAVATVANKADVVTVKTDLFVAKISKLGGDLVHL